MKGRNLLFLFVLASTLLFACTNDELITPASSGVKSVSVSLTGFKPSPTKAGAPTDVISTDTKNVTSVLINITDEAGNIVATKTVSKNDAENSDWDKLTDPAKGLKFVNIGQNTSKVYVYGNPGTTVTDNNVNTKLADQQGSAVLYYGVDNDLTPIVTEPVNPDPTSGLTYTANVSLKPIIARLQIKSISFKESGTFEFSRRINNQPETAEIAWDGFSADLKGIYMNNFYNTLSNTDLLTNLLNNETLDGHIIGGQWLFDAPAVNATEFASYVNYENDQYNNLPLDLQGKCYAFNFFPGLEVPLLHLDLANISITNMTSTNHDVFNPAIAENMRFCNIVRYYKNQNEEMKASDFKPGTLYNMDVEIIPMLDNDLNHRQYNVLVHVTIEPWLEETIIPGFNVEQ